MRRLISSWSKTLTSLGFKRTSKSRKRSNNRFTFESLEQRLVFSTERFATPFLVGPCGDGTDCGCANVMPTSDSNATTRVDVGSVSLGYNGATQPHPILTFNLNVSSPPTSHPDAVFKIKSEGTLAFDDLYFAAPESGGWHTFAIQADASALTSGRYYWLGEYGYVDPDFPDEFIDDESDHFFSFQDVVNRDRSEFGNSEFGAGWYLPELDRLVPQHLEEEEEYNIDQYGVTLITGDNHAVWFGRSFVQDVPGFTLYTREVSNPYSFAGLKKNNSTGEFTLTEPDGSKSFFDSDGLLQTREDRHGNVLRSYDYTISGLLDSITDSAGLVTDFQYDCGLVYQIDTGDRTTLLEYDENGRLTKVIESDPDGEGPLSSPVTNYAYYTSGDAENLLKEVTDPRGLTTHIEYDFTRRVDTITERCGGVIDIDSIPSQLVVDFNTSPTNLANLRSSTSTNSYIIDVTEQREIFGRSETITRNKSSQITSLTDEHQNTTLYSYYYSADSPFIDTRNGFGLLYQVIAPDPDGDGPLAAPTTTYKYDDFTDLLGGFNVTKGQLTSVENPIGTQYWTYDEDFGQVESYSDDVHSTSYVINSGTGNVDNMTQSVTSGNLTTSYTYTGVSDGTLLGLVKTITDHNGNETHYTYYASGLVEDIIYAEGTDDEVTVHYDYDSRNRIWKITNGVQVTEFQYDNLDRLIKRIDPDPDGTGLGNPLTSPIWQYRYDQAGNQTHVIDPLGNITEYLYDVRGRVMQVIQSVADPEATPDTSLADDHTGTVDAGSWSQITRTGSVEGDVYATDGNGGLIFYLFDGLAADKKYAVQVRWSPSTTPTEYDSNALFGVYGDYSEAPLHTMRADLNSKPQGLPDGSGMMWLSLGAFSPFNNTLTIELQDDDNNGKLVIDAVRIIEVGPVTQTEYDCNGNLIKSIDPLNNASEFEYDELDRLVERTDPDPDGGGSLTSPVTHYTYNALGWLTSVIDPEDHTTFYQYDEMGRRTKEVRIGEQGLTGEITSSGTVLHELSGVVPYSIHPDEFFGHDDLPEGFSMILTGGIYLDIEDFQQVDLFVANTDRCEIYIDDQLVLSSVATSAGAVTDDDSFQLARGWHTIKIVYDDLFENDDLVVFAYDLGGGWNVVPITALGGTQVTTTKYDANGRIEHVLDPHNRGTKYEYDEVDRLTREADVIFDGSYTYTGPETNYEYDANEVTVTDSLDNSTVFTYDHMNRLKTEEIVIDSNPLTRTYEYDDNNNLTQMTDRLGRVTTYDYDFLNRLTAEKWYDDAEDETANHTIAFFYDAMNRLKETTDTDHGYSFDYDKLGRRIAYYSYIDGLDVAINFESEFDAAGNRKQLLAIYDVDPIDFVNTYEYDALNRLTRITQDGVGLPALPKRFDFAYNAVGQLDWIKRYASDSTSNAVASTDYAYDSLGRLTTIDHREGSTPGSGTQIAGYGYSWNSRNDLTGIDFLPSAYDDEDVAYDYDDRGQLTGADYDSQTDESYDYDDNGNRTSGGSTPGDYNRLATDGTYNYEYDDEGNLRFRIKISDDSVSQYDWDHRNRLIAVTEKTGLGMEIQKVVYRYDASDQLIGRKVFLSGSGTPSEQQIFVNENGQVVMQFDKAGPGTLTADDLSHRYLWGPAVDQLLADEVVNDLYEDTENEVRWALTDHLGTVRDWIESDGDLLDHAEFDAFGRRIDSPAIDAAFGWTGRWRDDETGLQFNNARWYNPDTGRWMSEDPIGFAAGDANLYRYVGNQATTYIDPLGLVDWEFPTIPPSPGVPPGPGWSWEGPGPVGGSNGHWHGPNGEQLHPDLNHPLPKGPHWGLRFPGGNEWEYYPNGGGWCPNKNNRPDRPGFAPKLPTPPTVPKPNPNPIQILPGDPPILIPIFNVPPVPNPGPAPILPPWWRRIPWGVPAMPLPIWLFPPEDANGDGRPDPA